MTGLAIIHISYDPEEILVMRSHLDAHDIPNWVFNENHMSVNPMLRVGLGGMRLHVIDAYREEAASLIHQDQSHALGDALSEMLECPNCAGTSFRSMRFKWISFILLWSSLTTGAPAIPFVPDSRFKRCLQCYRTVKSGYKKRHWPFLFTFAVLVFLVPLAMLLIV